MSQDARLPSRRKALQFLASAPLLPLGSFATASMLTGCGGGDGAAVTFSSASFSPMSAPALSAASAMATTTVGSSINLQFSDSTTATYKLAYQPFFITGDMVPNGNGGTVLSGGYFDINNKPIMDNSVVGSERQFYSDAPDGTSLLTLAKPTVPGVKGQTVFAVVQ
ncbi:MAG: hypothetical protein Q7U75_02345, partial [Desulfobacterales bacterium]|nr:hypothetical protein [Desulfobacterales bacterium]